QAQAQAPSEAQASVQAVNDGADPPPEAGGCPVSLTANGAEREARASGQLSTRLPVPQRAAAERRPSGRPAPQGHGDSRPSGDDDGDDSGEAQAEDRGESLSSSSSAAAMLDIFRSIPTQMKGRAGRCDYKGQKLAEQIFQAIILVSAIIGFIYGYITEQFGWTVYIVMAGFALSCLLTLPPWPMYRRNPLKWLPVQESGTDDKKPVDRKAKRHAKS
ncbi:SPCS1 peptidase, partial [Anseranas semipalmata]|nr:SPCS1 peptidase [Anseranas semipalmata]